jgi:hypothetical protein
MVRKKLSLVRAVAVAINEFTTALRPSTPFGPSIFLTKLSLTFAPALTTINRRSFMVATRFGDIGAMGES